MGFLILVATIILFALLCERIQKRRRARKIEKLLPLMLEQDAWWDIGGRLVPYGGVLRSRKPRRLAIRLEQNIVETALHPEAREEAQRRIKVLMAMP